MISLTNHVVNNERRTFYTNYLSQILALFYDRCQQESYTLYNVGIYPKTFEVPPPDRLVCG